MASGAAQSLRLGWDDERTIELQLAAPLGEPRARRRAAARTRPPRPARLGRRSTGGSGSGSTPRRRRCAGSSARSPRSSIPATRSRGRRATGSSSPTCGIRPRATACARSTGARARRAAMSTLVVNERHPERNADVILLLDTFADARCGDRSTLDLAVRATATLASRYLERRDRVGLVSFGGILRWLTPGMGGTQRYRIVDALLESEVVFNYAWKDVSVIPAASAAGRARDRDHAAPRRPRRRGPRRPARACATTSRSSRSPRPTLPSRAVERRPARLPPLAAAA